MRKNIEGLVAKENFKMMFIDYGDSLLYLRYNYIFNCILKMLPLYLRYKYKIAGIYRHILV